MKKNYLLIILFIFSSFLYQCKSRKKEDPAPETPTIPPVTNEKPCKISSFSTNGTLIVALELSKDDQGRVIKKETKQPEGLRTTTIEYNNQGQKIRERFYDLFDNQPSLITYFEYNEKGQLVTRKSKPFTSNESSIEKLEYNEQGQLEKIWKNSISPTVYAHLIYNADGDLIQVDWCDSATGQCSIIETYEYDKNQLYVPIPETFVLPFLVDFDYGKHFCTKINKHLTNGEIGNIIVFNVEKINEKGNPTSISVYPQGGNVKSTYEYNYDCN